MAISFINSATGSNTATLPANNAGDMIIVFTYREGSTTPPSLNGNFTNLVNGSLTNGAYRVGYRISAGSEADIGTWTNATACIAMIYRGVATPPGTPVAQGTTTSTVTYPALTLLENSWVVGFSGSNDDTNTGLDTPPTGMTFRESQRNTVIVTAHDTNGLVSSWSAQTRSQPLAATAVGITMALRVASTGSWYVMVIGD